MQGCKRAWEEATRTWKEMKKGALQDEAFRLWRGTKYGSEDIKEGKVEPASWFDSTGQAGRMIRAGSRASAGSMGMTPGWYAGSWKAWQIRLEMTYIEGGSGVRWEVKSRQSCRGRRNRNRNRRGDGAPPSADMGPSPGR